MNLTDTKASSCSVMVCSMYKYMPGQSGDVLKGGLTVERGPKKTIKNWLFSSQGCSLISV